MFDAKTCSLIGLVALSLSAGPVAMAQESNWYLGANIGRTKSTFDERRITQEVVGGASTSTGISEDRRHTGYKLFGGYRFIRYFAVEGGYFDLGKFGFTTTTTPAGSLRGTLKVRGVNLDAVGILPINERFSALGRVGVIHAETRDSFSGTGAGTPNDSRIRERDTSFKVGAGLQYDFNDTFGVRAEAERYRIDDAVGHKDNVDFLSVGLIYRFVRQVQVPPRKETPTAVSILPPELAPVLVVVPVAARTQQYCTILDIQFEINKEDIQREEKERLAVLGTFLAKYPDTTAVIEGHTDGVGSDENNLTLSQRRAERVVAYLVDTLHISPTRLRAVGYGESRPLGDNATEEGKRKNRRINAVVACVTDIEGLSVAPARITMAMLIEFDRNEASIRPQYNDELRKVANFLKANPAVTATVEGHTANLQGSPEMAMNMSKRRAQNVVDHLVDTFGIDRSRLSVEGFGQGRRFAYNTSAEGQQENRRVNIIINYPN